MINELSSYGIKFSQDDFGDGYSSLNYLTQLNISTLKLSKNLTDGILDGFNNRLLINTVIELAHELGFEVIVEGVESEEVINVLKNFNCDYIQGYYYYKPLPYTKLVEICGVTRLDSIAVVDCPKEMVLNNKGLEANALRTWRNTDFN